MCKLRPRNKRKPYTYKEGVLLKMRPKGPHVVLKFQGVKLHNFHSKITMSEKAQIYRALLNSGEFIVSPGVYDGYSVRLVEAAGFKTAATSGAAVSNALLGVPDAGMMGLSENANQCRNMAR